MKRLIYLFILFVCVTQVFAHSGGLDSTGGHYNRKTDVYHCHRCPCGCPDEVNKSVSPSTSMRERPKSSTTTDKSISQPSTTEFQLCTKVIDGDTIILDGTEKVRLIGIDTPETKHPKKPVEYFGKEATAFTKRMVEGKKVRLEYDQQRIDKYGRTLAYIYLEDGTFLNAEIIKQGYGFAYTKFPFKYLTEFREHEKMAREQNKGLWGK